MHSLKKTYHHEAVPVLLTTDTMPLIQDYEIFGIDIPYMTEASTTNGVASTMAQVNVNGLT